MGDKRNNGWLTECWRKADTRFDGSPSALLKLIYRSEDAAKLAALALSKLVTRPIARPGSSSTFGILDNFDGNTPTSSQFLWERSFPSFRISIPSAARTLFAFYLVSLRFEDSHARLAEFVVDFHAHAQEIESWLEIVNAIASQYMQRSFRLLRGGKRNACSVVYIRGVGMT